MSPSSVHSGSCQSSSSRHAVTALSFYQSQRSSGAASGSTPRDSNIRDGRSKKDRRKDTGRARPYPKGTPWLLLLLGIYLYQCRRLFYLYQTSTSSSHVPPSSYLGSPKTRSRQSVLPKRVIAIFGTESSGSTFLATTLAIASGAFPKNGTRVTLPTDRENNPGRTIVENKVARRALSPNGELEIQHLSLPWGFWGSQIRNCLLSINTTTVEALVPEPCFRYEYQADWEHRLAVRAPVGCRGEAHISSRGCGTNDCGMGANEGYALYPRRFFVNVTSHLEWYLQRGVDITIVLSIRDRSISRAGKQSMHCKDERVGRVEEEKARTLMSEALRKYGRKGRIRESGTSQDAAKEERAIAVSYETLMALQESYLFDIYKTLGIDSTYVPQFKDGNVKYVKNQR